MPKGIKEEGYYSSPGSKTGVKSCMGDDRKVVVNQAIRESFDVWIPSWLGFERSALQDMWSVFNGIATGADILLLKFPNKQHLTNPTIFRAMFGVPATFTGGQSFHTCFDSIPIYTWGRKGVDTWRYLKVASHGPMLDDAWGIYPVI
jgi:hypothetical protein